MLRWAVKPSKAFDNILIKVLEGAINYAKDISSVGCWDDLDPFECAKFFSAESFQKECKILQKSIESPKVFQPTEYHFYLMYYVLKEDSIVSHDEMAMNPEEDFYWFRINDDEMLSLRRELEECGDYSDSKEIDGYIQKICSTPLESFDHIVNNYFWDLDFLTDPDTFNNIGSEGKAAMCFSEGTFGVVNGLIPTSEELVMCER